MPLVALNIPKTSWQQALDFTLPSEGGFVDDPTDSGGATNHGVSLRFLRGLGDTVAGDVDGDGDIDAADVKLMTKFHACEVYRREFWEKYGYFLVNDPHCAAKIFDMCVNMGPAQAHKIWQRALNRCGYWVAIDGCIGPKTMTATNQLLATPNGQQRFLEALRDQAKDFYLSLIENNPKYKKYERGWLKRAAL